MSKLLFIKEYSLLIIILALFFSEPVVYAQDVRSLFDEGNQLYQKGEYEKALERYEEITEGGYESGELYYNIGNAYYKLNNMGKAVLNYERAKRFLPEDDDLLTNITLVTMSLTDRITPLPEVFYVRYWNGFRRALSLSLWKAVFFAAWFISVISIIILLFIRSHWARKILNTGLLLSVFIVLLTAAVLVSSVVMDKPGFYGIVMVKEVRVLSEPSETSMEIFLIHEGTKVHVKRSLGDWIEISLADGKVGWIQKKTIEII